MGVVIAGAIVLGITLSPALPRTTGVTPDIPHAIALAIFQLGIYFGPFAYLVFFWLHGDTPGSRAVHIHVVDGRTGGRITTEQALLRVAGVFVGVLCLGMGLLAAVGDSRRRTWHDRMAGTVVVRDPVWAWSRSAQAWAAPHWGYPPAWGAPPMWGPPPDWGAPPPAAVLPEPTAAAEPAIPAERTAWTWTDVVPVLVVFFPLARLAARGVANVARAVNGSPLSGAGLSLEVLVADIAAYGVNIILILLLVTVRRHQPWRSIGWRPAPTSWIVAALFFGPVAIGLSGIAGQLSDSLFPGTPNNQCADIRAAFGGLPALALVATVLVAPVAEETVFRGFVLAWLLGRTKPWVAAVVSAALFSTAHYAYGQPTIFLPIFCVGLVLAVMYTYTRSIWPGVIVHAGLNLLSTVVLLTRSGC